MNNIHGSALPAAAASLAPWELRDFPLSLFTFGPSNITYGTVSTRPANRATAA
ncbi:MAG: hypothetical protein JWR85_3353 [Marmoricola sp.]|nr:hypothetical protein [Marmoricola sp.]